MARQLRRAAVCLNCGHAVDGNFCSECGQENTDYRVSLRRLLGDVADELFQVESRLWRSLWHPVRYPGRLTREYNAGRRVRYTSPLRLYLLTSVVYFGLAAWFPPSTANLKVQVEPESRGDLPAPRSDFQRRLRDRVGGLAELGPDEASRRLQAVMLREMPKAVAVLLPIFALLTMALFRRPRRFFVEHLVASLHGHAVGFLLAILTLPVRSAPAQALLLVAGTVWTAVFIHEAYEASWPATIWKGLVVLIVYGLVVSLALAAAVVVGLLYG